MFAWLDRLQPVGGLFLRVVLGAVMVAHGYHKIIPHGALYDFTHFVAKLGMPAWLGYVAAFTEFFGGMLLIAGLLTRFAAFAVAIDMGVAVFRVHLRGGLTGPGGFEFPLALLVIALMLVFTGSGVLALDNMLGRGSTIKR